MIRALIGVLIAALAAAFIRGLIGMITKEVGQMMNPEAPGETNRNAQESPKQGTPIQGTPLRKCKACETYSPAGQMLEGLYCSTECRDSAQAA
jgi:hypothetical protein